MMKKRFGGSIALAMVLLMTLVSTPAFGQKAGPLWRGHPHAESQGLIENLRAAGNFTKLLLVLDKAGLTGTLSELTKSFTLFAPDDDAFSLLPAVLVANLTADPVTARAFILPYILSGKLTGKDLTLTASRNRLKTLAGSSLQVSNRTDGGTGLTARNYNGLLVIFDAAKHGNGDVGEWPCCGRIVSADHLTANGIYHAITFVTASGGVWR